MLSASSIFMVVIAPSFIDFLRSRITKSTFILYWIPSPLQSGQEPYGALNENILGSNSSNE